MTFLAPGFLFASALVIVIIALHINQRRTISVPSVALWRHFQVASPISRRTLHWPAPSLLLFLQIAAVLAAALALAYPLLSGEREPEHWVVVLDQSASMRIGDAGDGLSRLQSATLEVAELAQAAGPHGIASMSVILAGIEPSAPAVRQAFDAGAFESLLGDAATTDGRADWTATLRLIRGTIAEGEPVRVIVATDRPLDSQISALEGEGIAVDVVSAGTAIVNTGLVARATPLDRENGRWLVSGEVVFSGRAGQSTVTIGYQAHGAASPVDWAALEVEAPGIEDDPVAVPFEHEITLPADGMLVIRGEADAAPFDDVVRIPIARAPPALDVLYIGEGGDLPILRALRALESAAIYTAQDMPSDDARFGLVVVDGVAVSRAPRTNTLWIGAGRTAGEAEPAVLGQPDPVFWRNDHRLAAGIDWAPLGIRTAYSFSAWPDGDVLLEASDGPLIQARSGDDGREVRLAFDPADSDWPEQASFPGFISRLADWAGLDRQDASYCVVGLPCAIDASLAGGAITLTGAAAALAPEDADRIRTQIRHGGEGGFLPWHTGVYRFDRDGKSAEIVVNPAPGGSVSAEEGSPAPVRGPVVLATVFAGLFGLFLAIEAVLAGRGGERFLTRSGLAGSSPASRRRRWVLVLRAGAVMLVLTALLNLPVPMRDASEHVAVALGAGGADIDRRQGGGERILHIVTTDGEPAIEEESGTQLAAQSPGEALMLAAGLIPPDRPGRIVLADTGTGSLAGFADVIPGLRQRGLAVDYLPPPVPEGEEVMVRAVSVPQPLYAGDSFPLTGLVHSSTQQRAEIAFLANGETLAATEVDLDAGNNRIETLIGEAEAGETLYEIAVSATGDTVLENNRSGVAAMVGEAGTVAVIGPDIAQIRLFAGALTEQGLTALAVPPSRAPFYLRGWLDYDVIVLMNVPALDLTMAQQQLIETAVFEHGRGLMIVGGNRSFGPGGYLETVLEHISPLSSNVPRETPEVALAFVLDRSGSMQQSVGGTNRLEVAKQATLRAVDQLSEESQVSVIVFDDDAQTVMELQPVPSQNALAAALRPVDPGGGTAIYPGLEMAYGQLLAAQAAAKHVIVMTDGLSQPGPFDALVPLMRADGITISTVAIGSGASPHVVERIAQMGGGAFHATADFEALPSILSQEAMLLSGAPLEEGATQPVWVDRSPPFLNPLPEDMPAIDGFVLTSAKPEAAVLMVTPDGEGELMPLLAHWRFGNGRVMALATDGTGAWTQGWQRLDGYGAFWAEAIRQFLPGNPSPGLSLTARRWGEEINVALDALDALGEPSEGLTLAAVIEGPDNIELPLNEVRPGHYQARFTPSGAGTYSVSVSENGRTATAPVHMSYPLRFDFARADTGAAQLAELTGGSRIEPGDPLFGFSEPRWTAVPGWPIWLLAALALFLGDLFIRYGRPAMPRWRFRRSESASQTTSPPRPAEERGARAA